MRKIIVFFSLIILSLCFSGCSCREAPTISALVDKLEIGLNEEIKLDSSIFSISEEGVEYSISIANDSIAKVEDNTLIPLKSGETSIVISLDEYDDISLSIPIEILNVNLAQNVSIPKAEVNINLGNGKNAINRVQRESSINEIPNITYDTNIISYDYATGMVTAISLGSTVVNITYRRCSVSFKVNVVEIVYVSHMHVDNIKLYVGDKGVFDFIIYPNNANQYRFYTESDLLEVTAGGEFVLKQDGEAIVSYEYYMPGSIAPVIKVFTVTISKLPDSLDFDLVTEDNEIMPYIFKGDRGKILFNFTDYELLKNFQFSSNIEVIGEIESNDRGDYYIYYKALEKGDVNITITCVRNIENMDRTLSKTKQIKVYDYEDIETIVKSSIYLQEKDGNGEYVVNLSDPSALVKELNFNLIIDGMILLDNIEYYCTNLSSAGSKYALINNYFKPNSVGRYQISIVFKGVEVDNFVVVAI